LSLNGLGGRFWDLGRPEEALAPARQAIESFRKLAEIRPAVFVPHLASGLHNLGLYLIDLELYQQALLATEEAIHLLLPAFTTSPRLHEDLIGRLADLYEEAAQGAGVQPDSELLGIIDAGIRDVDEGRDLGPAQRAQ